MLLSLWMALGVKPGGWILPKRGKEDGGVESVRSNGTTLGRVAGVRGASVTPMNLDRVGFDANARAHPDHVYQWFAARWSQLNVPTGRRSLWSRAQGSGWSANWLADGPWAGRVFGRLGAYSFGVTASIRRMSMCCWSRIHGEILEAGREWVSVNQVDGLTPLALVPGHWWRGRLDACGGIETVRSSTQAWCP